MHTTDVLLIAWAVFLSAVNVVFSARLPYWRIFLALNAASVIFIVLLATARGRTNSKAIRIIHDWYLAPAVFLTFKQLYYMIKPIHLGADYDDWLIAADRWLFGVDPTVWLYRFAHPVLTEVLMIAYTLFYLLFLIIGSNSTGGASAPHSICSCSRACMDSSCPTSDTSRCPRSVPGSRCTISRRSTANCPVSG